MKTAPEHIDHRVDFDNFYRVTVLLQDRVAPRMQRLMRHRHQRYGVILRQKLNDVVGANAIALVRRKRDAVG
jgi:hypothetical protein